METKSKIPFLRSALAERKPVNTPNIPKPKILYPEKRQITTISEKKQNAAETKTTVVPQFAPRPRTLRRSMSHSDINKIRPALNLKSLKTLTTATAAPKIAQKNQGIKRPNADNKPTEVKAKVSKSSGPSVPVWDYKTRFFNLNEKHTEMVKKYKSSAEKIAHIETLDSDLKETKNSLEQCQQRLESIESENSELLRNQEVLTVENVNFAAKIKSLSKEIDELKTEKANFKKENEKLTDELTLLKTEFNTLKHDHELLRQEKHALDLKHSKLVPQYESLKEDFNSLNKEHVLKCTEAKNVTAALAQAKEELYTSETIRRKLHNDVQDLKGNIRVFCRVRPPINEDEDFRQCAINFTDDKNLEIKRASKAISTTTGKNGEGKCDFSFDRVFGPACSQELIFEDLAQLVQSALDGYHVCVFAYGQTGSGKTYTMQGENSPAKLGMIPRSIDLIFEIISNLEIKGWKYKIAASFLEIYNETIRDLLDPNTKKNLEIRFNDGKGTTVTNLKIEPIKSAHDLKMLMLTAQKNRAVAVTDFNEHSSRSHAVTKIYLEAHHEDTSTNFIGSINLVDLAGSESAKTSKDDRLAETKYINKSLSTLGTVMLALHNNDGHIPYRNSKLTYLLQSCLGGNSKTLMFVNISPDDDCYGESINSLRFASKVKEVKTASRRNKVMSMVSLPPGHSFENSE